MGVPLIHSYVHGAGRQVSKSSERVRLEKHVLMDHQKKWIIARNWIEVAEPWEDVSPGGGVGAGN